MNDIQNPPVKAVNKRRSSTFLLPENKEKAKRIILSALIGTLTFHLVLIFLFWFFDVSLPIHTATPRPMDDDQPLIVKWQPEDQDEPEKELITDPTPQEITFEELDPIDLELDNVILKPEDTAIPLQSLVQENPAGNESEIPSPLDIQQLADSLPAPPIDPAYVTASDVVINAPDIREVAPLDLPEAGHGNNPQGEDLQGNESLQKLLAQPGGVGMGDVATLQADLLFEFNKADLKPTARIGLLLLAALIEKNPKTRFIIEGHTDNFGTEAHNRKLSFQRAESVRNWLQGNGLDLTRIYIRACAADAPVVSTKGTQQEQARNRRVEIHMRKSEEPMPENALPATATLDDLARLPKATPSVKPEPKPEPKPQPKAAEAEVITPAEEAVDAEIVIP